MTSITPCDKDIRRKLEAAQLRPTRQRIVLAQVLFRPPHRHVSAEALHREVQAAGAGVSLATVYNTLHAFTEAGLLRQLSVEGSSALFDTNTSPHHHFIDVDKRTVVDFPEHEVEVARLPTPPAGMEIDRVEVTIRLRPAATPSNTSD